MKTLTKKCWVPLKRVSQNELAQQNITTVAEPSPPIAVPAKRTRRVLSCIVETGIEIQSNAPRRMLRPRPETTSQGVQLPLTNTDTALLPFLAPLKRSRRVLSCIDSFTFDIGDEVQSRDKNPVMQPQVANKTGEENDAGHDPNDVEMKSNGKTSDADAILLPFPAPAPVKRSQRVLSIDVRDEFQLSDTNPVIQPMGSGLILPHVIAPIPAVQNNENENKENRSSLPSARPVLPGLVPLTARPVNKQPECSSCFIAEQKIAKLKKRMKAMKETALERKQWYESKIHNIDQEATVRHLELCNQIDELQDKCSQLIDDNGKLREAAVTSGVSFQM